MSAFVVENNHINAILNYLHEHSKKNTCKYVSNYNLTDHEDLTKIGQILLDENIRSVAFRYKAKTELIFADFATSQQQKFDFVLNQKQKFTSIQILKALHCLEYQSCESPCFKSTQAYELIHEIEYITICNLQGYAEAEWTLAA